MKLSRRLVVLAALLFVAALALGNPHSTSWPLQCPLYRLTGWQCPLCGTQRAVHEALHGHLAEAWSLNPAFWLLLPLLVVWTAASLSRRVAAWPAVSLLCRDAVVFAVLGMMVVWGVVRNFCF